MRECVPWPRRAMELGPGATDVEACTRHERRGRNRSRRLRGVRPGYSKYPRTSTVSHRRHRLPRGQLRSGNRAARGARIFAVINGSRQDRTRLKERGEAASRRSNTDCRIIAVLRRRHDAGKFPCFRNGRCPVEAPVYRGGSRGMGRGNDVARLGRSHCSYRACAARKISASGHRSSDPRSHSLWSRDARDRRRSVVGHHQLYPYRAVAL